MRGFSSDRPQTLDLRGGPTTPFPRILWHADSESPAACVRASVSIPIFFQPYIVPADPALALPGAGVPANTLPNSKWSEVGFDATIPDRVSHAGIVGA